MGKLPLLLLLMFTIGIGFSQDPCASLNYHAFKAESVAGTYTDLENLGTEISVSNLDDGISGPQEIGFEFEYHCQLFTRFIFNTNGFIKLGTETNPKTNLFFANAQSTDGGIFSNPDSNNVNLIVVFNHDIETINPDPDFRVYTSGNAPYRVCTIQWKNMQEWSNDPASKQYIDMDFQLKLYETSNVIEFVYGDWGASANPSNYKTGACGLKGSGYDDDQLLVVVKSSAGFWDKVTFHNGNYAPNESFNFGNPPDRPKPDVGRTYRFTPTHYTDIAVRQLYALGDASRYYSTPQSISATIQNTGFNTLYDIQVMLDISGANTYRDTQYISRLSFMENARVTFPGCELISNGQTNIRITVGDDDFNGDNTAILLQDVNDFNVNYSSDDPPSAAYGFLSGAQGIYYAKYPVHGTASVNAVNAYLANNAASVGKTVFGIVLNAAGVVVARSENYVIEETDLDGWHTFSFATPPVLSNEVFYAGLGMTSSLTEFSPLGVQDESPVRPGTYYTSLVTGNGLKVMDTLTFSSRFMIGATLAGTAPASGPAIGDTTICAYGIANISLEEFTGFVTWQSSPDGLTDWQTVQQEAGSPPGSYTTPPLTSSTYYRAAVFQPGFGFAFSNVVFVEVLPPIPVITVSGDALSSSATEGNQWYDQEGMIPGATGQNFLALRPGVYYVVVTSGECVSAPSNTIEIITVATNEINEDLQFRIYPNPVGDELHVEMIDISLPVIYEIINAQGKSLDQGRVSPGRTIATDRMSPGLNFIKLETHGYVEVLRVIKTEMN